MYTERISQWELVCRSSFKLRKVRVWLPNELRSIFDRSAALSLVAPMSFIAFQIYCIMQNVFFFLYRRTRGVNRGGRARKKGTGFESRAPFVEYSPLCFQLQNCVKSNGRGDENYWKIEIALLYEALYFTSHFVAAHKARSRVAFCPKHVHLWMQRDRRFSTKLYLLHFKSSSYAQFEMLQRNGEFLSSWKLLRSKACTIRTHKATQHG